MFPTRVYHYRDPAAVVLGLRELRRHGLTPRGLLFIALNPRGEFYSEHNIAQALSMRDFLDQLRSSGVETGGPAPFGAADTRAFARELDRFLQKQAQADGAN